MKIPAMALFHMEPSDFRSPDFLLNHACHTLSFYAGRNVDASGGFFHFFKDNGDVYDRRPRHLVSSARFVCNHAMAYRHFGLKQDRQLVHHGIEFLHKAHAQPQGGFAWLIDWYDGRAQVIDGTNHCYGLALVLLAHAHALMAGVKEAASGIDSTFDLMERHFWEPARGLYADEATPEWQVGDYRGQNANMHSCEAMLAAYQATGQQRYLERAQTLANSIAVRQATLSGDLVWEHYRADWSVDWDYGRHDKANIDRPWGYQIGHLTQWAKLLLQLDRMAPADWLLPKARHFFATAMARGWDNVHGGLGCAFDPDGKLCDGDKYFWVQAESLVAAAWLAERTGEDIYWRWYERIWEYSWMYFVDHWDGAWYRILSPANVKLSDEKSPAGKTDYHTMGACYDVLRAMGVRPGANAKTASLETAA